MCSVEWMRDARVIVRGLLVDECVLIEDGPETASRLQSQVHATCTLLDEHNSKGMSHSRRQYIATEMP